MKTCSIDSTCSLESRFLMNTSSRSCTNLLTLKINFNKLINKGNKINNLQRSIVFLKSPGLSPGIAMTGIVKCADKALTKWD